MQPQTVTEFQRSGSTTRSKRSRLHALQAIVIPIALLLILGNEASAHVPRGKPVQVYHAGMNQTDFAEFSFTIVLLLQNLGWFYLVMILYLSNWRPIWKPVILASCIQLGIAVPFVVVGFLACMKTTGSNLLSAEAILVMPSGIETIAFIRPEFYSGLWMTLIVSFLAILGVDFLILQAVKSVQEKFVVALVHALVMHPLFLPIGQLIGLMHVVYVFRVAPKQHV